MIFGSLTAQIQFQDHVIIDDTFLPNGPFSVHAADIDGDGYMDLLSASRDDNKIAWYKNNGAGNFQTQQAISTNANLAISVYAADIDGDGDVDVLSASFDDDKIAWYENTDGQGSFSTERTISLNADGAEMVFAADIDGDGDMDVLSTSGGDDKIAWYENLGPLSVPENALDGFVVYPNPTSGVLTVKAAAEISKLEIYNQLGQLVLENEHQNSINISKVDTGLYFLKIYDSFRNNILKKVVKI
ncbi:hypothetical protein LS48_13030 [Aequorivita aquimaris]|uniref:Secretion system C-terminal sorting domain-containing protein n=1 Tax=Aequorivita aquimaris TaxID=1548749 RepID=A0A137RFA3_9FLAO|nr:hypothetical protein LS48_13030 [Aequorivita aquimaris]